MESRVLPSPGDGTVRVKTRIEHCILIYRVELIRVEDVYEMESYRLLTVIVPSLGNFRSGSTEWLIVPQGEQSRFVYIGQFEPDFLIFPIIGPAIVKRIMRKEMTTSLAMTECSAKMLYPLDWNIHLQIVDIDIQNLRDKQ